MHKPVLLNEILEYLDPKPGQKFIDATIDGGGHGLAILERILPEGQLLGVEWDGELLKILKLKIENIKLSQNVILAQDSYVNLKKIADENNFIGADGILLDLGLSSWHLESAGRGFTFMKDERLDMRFDSSFNIKNNVTAEEIVNRYTYDELVKILKEYGEERFAKLIAARIIKTRKNSPIQTTFELVEIIKNSVPFWYRRGRLHFATKTFQALRIAVNDELGNIKIGLEQAVETLGIGGRLAVITFHSLEDRIVKNFFRDKKGVGVLKIETKKPIVPSLAEVTANPKARSAKLRVAAKLGVRC